MGNTFGDSLGQANSLSRIGLGRSVRPEDLPQYASVSYRSWRRGMIAFVSPENTPEDAGRDVQDIAIDYDDSLVRPEGIVLDEDVTPRSLRWLFEQAGIDYATELVAIDAPYLGYKSIANFTFVDAGIAVPSDNGWNAVNVLGVLIFSDGTAVTYAREPGEAVVIDISADIIARTFANAFGRTFAGAFTDPIDGLFSLGIRWNGTSAVYSDWSGTGSGEELLISNSLEADKIVALRPIGFDALAILCRNSIWIGYPTQQADRPADFRIRHVGKGCVSEPCATISPDGVPFLSDEGVMMFNQNELTNISEEINPLLLPLDYTQLDRYKLIYDPADATLKLQTPTCTWVYEFEQMPSHGPRWTRRSFALDNLVAFTDQSGNLYWGTVQGTWDDQTLTWAEMVQNTQEAPHRLYAVDGSILGRFDPTEEEYLGVAMDPCWETPNKPSLTPSGEAITERVTTMGLEIEYSSTADTEMEFRFPDENGDFTQSVTQTLVSTAGKRRRSIIWFQSTGQGIKLQYAINIGRPKLYSIRQLILDSGPATGSAA